MVLKASTVILSSVPGNVLEVVVPVGSVSVTATLRAIPAPLLVTVRT